MKILIIKPSSFGDIIQANPTLTALKKAYPGARISWLVFERWAEAVRLFPDVDDIVTWDRSRGVIEYFRVLRRIRKERFDMVIDLQGLARSALLAFLSGAEKKIGAPGMKEMSGFLVREIYPESRLLNAVFRSLEAVRYLTNARQSVVFNLAVGDTDEQNADGLLAEYGIAKADRLVGIIPSARGRGKQWPIDNYIQLADRITRTYRGTRIIVLGARDDAGKLLCPGAVDLSGRTPLRILTAVLKRCSVVIGGDTGPIHLAAALNVPVVVMFGGSDITETSPVTSHSTVLKKNFACSPCRGKAPCEDMPCMRAISTDEVYFATSQYLTPP